MFLFIAMLVSIAMSVIWVAIRSRIKTGRPLTRVQTNVAVNYITLSRRIGKNTYRVLGVLFIGALAIGALMSGAWIVAGVMCLYIYLSLRTQGLIDRTSFLAINQTGVEDPQGAYLQPRA